MILTKAETQKGRLFLIPSLLSVGEIDKTIPNGTIDSCRNLRYFLMENPREGRRFLSKLQMPVPIQELHVQQLDKNTSAESIGELLSPLSDGHDVGVISDAGCPGVADPGSMAVAFAHKMGFTVIPLVGPSSFLLALMASGFSGQSFTFHGYIPIDKRERNTYLKQMEEQSFRKKETQIFMETPYRNNSMLESLLSSCRGNTQLCIAADITGESEYIRTLPLSSWKKEKPDLHKIPAVFLLFCE